MATTLLLADDHRLVREGLRRLLETRSEFEIVAEAGDGEQAVRAALVHCPDVALIDLTMPRMSGTEAIRRICADLATRCIAVSMHELIGQVAYAFEAGASGYVVKSAASSELLGAVDAVVAGGTFLSPAVAHWAVDAVAAVAGEPARRLHAITAREREVLQLIAEGLSTKEIASALGVGIKTIETHRANLMTKLEIRKASGLVKVAIQAGLITY